MATGNKTAIQVASFILHFLPLKSISENNLIMANLKKYVAKPNNTFHSLIVFPLEFRSHGIDVVSKMPSS